MQTARISARRRTGPSILLALAALLLVGLTPAVASAWGFFGHVAIGDEAAKQLGFSAEEHDYFVLGSLMGDLDKSDHLQQSIGGSGLFGGFLRWAARVGNGYMFPALVDQHSPSYAAELIERAHDTGDRKLVAWALGVMCHGMSDRFTDRYPDPNYRVSSGDAEVSVDMTLFRSGSGRRYKDALKRIEKNEHLVHGARPQIASSWWLFRVSKNLKRGRNKDREVRQSDPFADLILDTHRAVFGAQGGPANVSDVCRQQIAMDAFTWNYRLKSYWMPGWRSFARQKGSGWYRDVDRIMRTELVPHIVTSVRDWQDHLDRRARGAATTRPSIP